ALLVCGGAVAQTVTVPGGFSTISAAIASFSGDVTPGDNVVEITTVGPHTDVITIGAEPITIRGNTGGDRPIILLQDNGGDGIVVNNGSNLNAVENVILLPASTSTPTDDGIWITGAGTECSFTDVLITANNGSDQPAGDPTGLTLPDLTGAIPFPDECLNTSAGGIFHLTNTVITANPGTSGNSDLIGSFSSSGQGHTINEGCVLSYAPRYCAQINSGVTIQGTRENPVIFHGAGQAGGYGVGVGHFGGGTYSISNAIISGTGGTIGMQGMYIYDSLSGDTNVQANIEHVAFVNNAGAGLEVWTGTTAMPVSGCTFVNNGNAIILSTTEADDVDINVTDTIVAGNGSTVVDENSILNDTLATITLNHCAAVTDGTYALNAIGASLEFTISDNPIFYEVNDFTQTDFLDVGSAAYETAATGGMPLKGYGDYAPVVVTGVEDAELYR
ncbi:hypothetical protein JXA47_02450, partial [Candidatus Sumerlaeota bacterium]|nr:hypothetical protein [Candidatus Sumerlaeota bacterium]